MRKYRDEYPSLILYIDLHRDAYGNNVSESTDFVTIDGKQVDLCTIRGGELTLQATNYGCRVVSLWAPDRNGKLEDVVLGYDCLEKYVHNSGERFLGPTVGPVANRIANGKFSVDGIEYTLPQNNNGQTLHGGLKGVDLLVWDIVDRTDSSLTMSLCREKGLDGFPGDIHVEVSYTLTSDNRFVISYRADSDEACPLNFSNHSIFNLKGEGNGTILDHELTIFADATTPVDSVLIPTGEIAPVEGTPFDFREAHTIGERIDADDEQLRNGNGYDHNWVLRRESEDGVELAAILYEPASGREMRVYTDQKGLQFYAGNFFDGLSSGKYGRTFNFREALALETQNFPDAVNHENFPESIYRPGEEYHQTCICEFNVR